ncbi:hypothetical protein [Haloplanus halophilus]|uniref:hypothetical protein n=1 Tax=Haloplanus halophilus TaxID=2949993 RepID=UPI00203B50D4|nr:hypothetical protein [Haloplanus sp. GDY1]
MSDERDGGVAVSAVRERVAADDGDDVTEGVLAGIEERAADGRDATDAITVWHEECRRKCRAVAEDVDDVEERLREVLAPLDPAVRDTTQVQGRIDEYEDEFETFRSDLDAVLDRLAETERAPSTAAACCEAADWVWRCERTVGMVAHNCHHLEEEIEEFETWLHDPETRLDSFAEELDGFEEYLDNTEGLLDLLEAGGGRGVDPFDAWLAAYHLQRVMGVVFEELRTELAELDSWLAEQDGAYGDELATLRSRLDSLAERHEACSTRLDAAESAVDDFAERRADVAASLDRFEAAIADLEPPVDWGEVERLVSEQFEDLGIELS